MKKKLIVVNQKDIKDCGPCCLQSLIRYYDGYVSLEKIREDAKTTIQGTSVYHLLIAARKYGFDAIAKKYLETNLDKMILPAIVHVKYPSGQTHFLVLYSVKGSKLVVMDPAKGKVMMTYEEFQSIFTGVVIELLPKQKIVLLEKESNIYNLFIKIIKANKRLCISILLCAFLLTIFTIISGLYFKVISEKISKGFEFSALVYLIIFFFIIVLLKNGIDLAKSYYENHLNKNIDVSILGDFISHIFHLPLRVINSRSTGEIISRVNELSSVKDLFSQIFVSGLLDLILSLGTIICLFLINEKLALILCLGVALYLLVSFICNPYIYRRIKQNIELQTVMSSDLLENVDMITSIKNLDRTEPVLKKLENSISLVIYDNYTFGKYLNIFNFSQKLINDIYTFLILSFGFHMITTSNFTLVSLVTFHTLMGYFTGPIKNLISILPKYNFLRASFSKICDFVDLEEEKLGKREAFINGDICFSGVSFSYNDYTNILDNFNLVIHQKEKIMLKGKSGCGKSTICQLLQQNLTPKEGSITIGDKNILDYSLKTIRDNICYVGQKESLCSATIKNNILFYQKSSKYFDKVCKICMIEDIVKNKAFRYDFGIDKDSHNLSGGEKQRIVLARALLSNRQILILDEALSETDYWLEKQIITNIKKEFPNKTLIYISHKKQDALFDRVVTLKEVCNGC